MFTVSTDRVVMATSDLVMVYFDPSTMPTPLNFHAIVGVGSADTLHENVADRPIGTAAFLGPLVIIAGARERERVVVYIIGCDDRFS